MSTVQSQNIRSGSRERWTTHLGRASANPIENTSPHIATVRSGQGSPDVAGKANERREDQHGATAVGRLDRDPACLSG